MITIKQVYDNYPGSSDIGLEIDESTSLDDIEDCHGDSLFVFLCRELCDPDDECTPAEAVKRLTTAIRDLDSVRQQFWPDPDNKHRAKIIASQLHAITTLELGSETYIGLSASTDRIKVRHNPDGIYYVAINGKDWAAVGNVFGAMEAYMQFALAAHRFVAIDHV